MRRQLIYCPEVNDSSFVLLFEKGDSGESWSLRDYSLPGTVAVRYAREFGFPLSYLAERTSRSLDAPVVSTNDLAVWHHFTLRANAELEHRQDISAEPSLATPTTRQGDEFSSSEFGLIDRERFMALAKARKTSDMRRIFYSPNSEDWVTWNVFTLLRNVAPDTWWEHLVKLAQCDNPDFVLPDGWKQRPTVHLWRTVPAPRDYESASRKTLHVDGSDKGPKTRPVEGRSEIDICIRNPSLTLFIEAKLGSDISLRTTYDPERNQILRNIDCLLEDAMGTAPLFWMLVRDSGQGKAYTQLMQMYREKPTKLIERLPHRDPSAVRDIAGRLSIVLWKDLVRTIPDLTLEDELTLAVFKEIHARIR